MDVDSGISCAAILPIHAISGRGKYGTYLRYKGERDPGGPGSISSRAENASFRISRLRHSLQLASLTDRTRSYMSISNLGLVHEKEISIGRL